jgi:hypothetical protein
LVRVVSVKVLVWPQFAAVQQIAYSPGPRAVADFLFGIFGGGFFVTIVIVAAAAAVVVSLAVVVVIVVIVVVVVTVVHYVTVVVVCATPSATVSICLRSLRTVSTTVCPPSHVVYLCTVSKEKLD